jgi:2-polyprenyl-3-methyl-5-hydroxy-6-metoxy-1,4-benzoquinol methylase
MTFDEGYFGGRQYLRKEEVVKSHVLEVLRWASKISGANLLNGKGKKALDIGCAIGYTSEVLTDLGYETCGLDISSWGIRQAKAKKSNQFIVCDAQGKIPCLTNSFDLVTCFDVLEHLSNPQKALVNMLEISRNIVVCTTPNKKVEKPIRKLMHDYDETHISVASSTDWQRFITTNIIYASRIEEFFDCSVRFGGKLFFKSFRIPKYGLTIRIVVKK